VSNRQTKLKPQSEREEWLKELREVEKRIIGAVNKVDATSRQVDLETYVPEQPKVKQVYSQDWVAYDLAKTNEDVLFKRLLIELLLFGAKQEKSTGKGRPGFSKREKIFFMCIKEYYKSDLRKATSILKELKNLNLISRVPCYKSICNFYNDSSLSKVLDDLILLSALPLASIETTGAIDATGFSTSKFESWNHYKWGKHEGKERIWRKLHAMTGCKTNIFLSAKVTEKNVADIKMVEDVVGVKPKYFQMNEFVGDKAYNSRKVFEFLDKLGLEPYIPFKKNIRGRSKGSRIWREFYLHFTHNREIFDSIYHQRSNIETSFHMLKQRFGNHLYTKNFTANQNEIKTRVLCHNICVLIQEAFESGISLEFEECMKVELPR